MSTTEMIDYRRMDQRRYIYQPYWISSSEVCAVASDDLAAVLFSFPAAKYGDSHIIVEKIGCQVVTALAGGTCTVNIGTCTLATDDVTTGGDTTDVDADDYVPTADVTVGTPAMYFAATGDWITAKLLMTELTPVIIVPADTTVPCIAAYIGSDGTITAGIVRVHALITEVPLAA